MLPQNNNLKSQYVPKKEIKSHLIKNTILLIFSISLAVFLVKIGIFEKILDISRGLWFIGSLIAGFFFPSVLTVGPATVALAAIVQQNYSPWLIAAIGAFGAMWTDFILFKFVRDRITDDFVALFRNSTKTRRLIHFLHLEIFKFLTPFIGIIIIILPLPDEIGLAMLGLAKINNKIFLPLSYLMHFCGILIVGFVAKMIN